MIFSRFNDVNLWWAEEGEYVSSAGKERAEGEEWWCYKLVLKTIFIPKSIFIF
jgi:hypothetical protein